MILPKKHLSIEESLFGFGAFLLQKTTAPTSVERLWGLYNDSHINKEYSIKFSFDEFILTLDYLFIIGAIEINGGLVMRCEVN